MLDLSIPTLTSAHDRFFASLHSESEIALRQFAAATLPDLVKAVGPETEGQGKGAIIADLFKVVIPVKPKQESQVIINPNPVRYLMSRRRYHGKVRRALKSRYYVRLADFNAYRDGKFKNVGLTAAGYLAAANELGVALPAWISEHGDSEGGIQIERSESGLSLTVTNEVPWAYFLPDAMSKSGYAIQAGSGKFYDLSVDAWDRAKRGF
jgi:hypothetical protein